MISLYIIAYNEGEIIARCINSFIRAVDEIVVVVDSKTTDETAEIARSLGAKVFDFRWIDDFSAMKNFAMNQCTGDWLMYADADDVLESGDIRKATNYADLNNFTMIVTAYFTAFDDNDNPVANNRVPRLVKAGSSIWRGKIHEYLSCEISRQWVSDIEIYHRKPAERIDGTARNTRMLEQALKDDSPERARYLFYLAREYMFAGRWAEAIEKFEEYMPLSNFPAEKHRAMCDESDCWVALGNLDKAMSVLGDAINFLPDYPDPFIKRGIIEHRLKNWDFSARDMREAIKRDGNVHLLFPFLPYNGSVPYEYLDYLSICYWNIGEIEKAYVACVQVFKSSYSQKRIADNVRFFEELLGLKYG